MPFSCRAVKRSLALHRWGEALPPSLMQHLEGCDRCRALAREDAEMWRRVGALDVPPPPPLVATRVLSYLDAQAPAAGWLDALHAPRLASWSLAAAVLLVVIGAGMGAWVGNTLVGDAPPPGRSVRAVVEPDSAELFEVEPPGFVSASLLLQNTEGRDGR